MEMTNLTTKNTDRHIGAALTIECAECGDTEWMAWRDGEGNRLSGDSELIEFCHGDGWQMRPIKDDEDNLEPVCLKCVAKMLGANVELESSPYE